MKNKAEIGRYDLQKNIMKYVLFRIDYIGVAETSDLYNIFINKFADKFSGFSKAQQNQYDIQINDLNSVSESLTIPVKEIQREEILKFSQNSFGTDKLTLNISRLFSTLQIECTEYKTIDDYLYFFHEMIQEFKTKIKFLNIKRIGLKKVGGLTFLASDMNVFSDTFNREYFSFLTQLNNTKLLTGRHFDNINYEDGPEVNITRIFQRGQMGENEAIQITLDLDGFLQNDHLEQENTRNILKDINDKLFLIFKEHMTTNFLNKNLYE